MARQIVVEIVGNNKKFSKALEDSQSKSSKFGSVLKGVGVGIGVGVFGLLTSGAEALVGQIGNAIDNASKLEQSTGAVTSVFGKASATITKFGETAATSLGLSKNQVNEMAAVMGAQLQGMGYSADEAAEATLGLQTRAADMAATFGGTTKDAVEAISSLMRGERDPIEKFGVSIKQADVNARILALGLDTSTAAAKKNAEATAAMDLLMEQTAKTAGTFAKESGSLAGKQQVMAAKFENASAAIGKKLLPVFVALADFVITHVIPVVEDLIAWFGELWEEIQPLVKQLANVLLPVFKTVVSFIAGTVIPVLIKIAKTTIPILISAVQTVANVFKTVFGIVSSVVGTAIGIVTGVIKNVTGAFTSLVAFVQGLPNRMKSALGKLFSPLWEGFRKALNAIIRGWNSLKFTVPSVDLGPLGKVGGFSIGTPNLPYFHQGGIVPGIPGSDVPIMAQAGEQVIPRRDVGRGGVTIIVQGNIYGGPAGLDQLSRDLATRLRTAGAI